jgi:hypothetical protein
VQPAAVPSQVPADQGSLSLDRLTHQTHLTGAEVTLFAPKAWAP